MDAQSRSIVEPYQLSDYPLRIDFPEADQEDDDFPPDLSSEPEGQLLQLCDALFLELDSQMPDLRALERYQTACDELTFRRGYPDIV